MAALESVEGDSMRHRKIHDFFPMNHLIPHLYVEEKKKQSATFFEQLLPPKLTSKENSLIFFLTFILKKVQEIMMLYLVGIIRMNSTIHNNLHIYRALAYEQ